MAISLKHPFTSPKADGPDLTQVNPSNWNAEHVLTGAALSLFGTNAAGAAAEYGVGAGTSYTPAVTANSGTITTKTTQGTYWLLGRLCLGVARLDITTNGTGAGWINLGLPFTVGSVDSVAIGREALIVYPLIATIGSGTSVMNITKLTDGSYPGANGTVLVMPFWFQTT